MMDFITLQTVLDGIVASIPARPYVSEPIAEKFKDDESMLAARQFWELTAPDLDNVRRYSDAAQKLNKALHHDAKPPQWAEYDKVKGFAVPAASIGGEGMDLLTHATGWGKRERELHAKHIPDSERNGWNPAKTPPARNMNDGQTPAGSFFRPMEIGFDRAEIITFLDAKEIAHDLGEQGKADTQPQRAPVVEVPASETPEQRRARWLDWLGKGERGAVQRVYERERLLNPKADRAFIGKQIKIARTELADKKRGGAWVSQLVQDGKR